MKSKFKSWFEDQFGKRPVPHAETEILKARLRHARDDVYGLEMRLNSCLKWDENERVCLYAWNARGTDEG